jgi:hypothetical protein
MRRYQGFMADSARWGRFTFRPDDVVISTPSKCGTTWMQTIVGMLILGRIDFGEPLSRMSPWLDMLIRTDDEVFGLLDAQTRRRWIKTHTPLDGVPEHPTVEYLAVIRHPLDVALSDRDHHHNMQIERAREMRVTASGEPDPAAMVAHQTPPDDPADMLRWFIDSDLPPTGSGPNSLADFCEQASIAWERRHRPNVHLFHYTDLWNDLDGEMRRVAAALGVEIDEPLWSELVAAARLDSMRSRAADVAPEADLGFWRSDAGFFSTGGSRGWASLLDGTDIAHFHDRLHSLAGGATGWILHGRAALD